MRVAHPALRRRWCREIGWTPHLGQEAILANDARFQGAICGVRFGKSKLAARILEADTVLPGSYGWAVGPTYDLADKVFREVWETFARQGVLAHGSSYSRGRILTVGGSIVERKSADNPDSLVGEGLNIIVMDEASRIRPRILFRELLPRLSDRRGRLFLITSPNGRDWVYDLHEQAARGEIADWWWTHQPTWANSCIFPGGRGNPEIRRVEKAYRDAGVHRFFRQEYGAEFVVIEGQVFGDTWDPRRHLGAHADVVRGINQWWVGYDWGWDHYSAFELLGRTSAREWRLVDEWAGRFKTPAQILEALNGLMVRNKLEPGQLEQLFYDPSRPEQGAMFVQAGYPATPAKRARAPEIRIPAMASVFAREGGFVAASDRVKLFPRQVEQYRFLPENNTGRLLVAKKDDDTVDAVGYVIASVDFAEMTFFGGIEDDD